MYSLISLFLKLVYQCPTKNTRSVRNSTSPTMFLFLLKSIFTNGSTSNMRSLYIYHKAPPLMIPFYLLFPPCVPPSTGTTSHKSFSEGPLHQKLVVNYPHFFVLVCRPKDSLLIKSSLLLKIPEFAPYRFFVIYPVIKILHN